MNLRTEREMQNCILAFVQSNARVMAVYLNGSRANPNVVKDKYRDFDIVFVVTEIAPFLRDRSWLDAFGSIAIIQEPDAMDELLGMPTDFESSYTFLILFSDGNRIDLHLETEQEMRKRYGQDSLTAPILDKVGILPETKPASDRGYWTAQPDEARYHACCNEFWWCLNNVAKGLVRDQMPYAMRMLHTIVMPQLEHMTAWRVASLHNFQINTGMWGKYFKKYLPREDYEMYLASYSAANTREVWLAIERMTHLFSKNARIVAERLGFFYRENEERGMMAYLAGMKQEWERN